MLVFATPIWCIKSWTCIRKHSNGDINFRDCTSSEPLILIGKWTHLLLCFQLYLPSFLNFVPNVLYQILSSFVLYTDTEVSLISLI